VDPVAEADVYLAYGRDMQAEEILKEALRTAPERMAVHRKLAEIYAKRRDAKALEQVANDALKASQGQGPDWEFIAGLGAELDPDNVLYRPGPGGKAPAAKAVAPTLSDEPPRSSFGAADTEPQSMPFGDSPVSVSSGIPLDLNLELDNAPVKTAAPAPKPAAPAAAPRPVAPQVSDLDFDLDLDAASDARVATQPPPAPSPVAAPEKSNDGMIEFDMDSLSSSLTLDSPGATGGSSEATMQPEAATEPTDSDPLSTKLALAQEFHAIGDTDGARALAKEVIAEASGAIKASAEQFLKELD
ncbi:MAG: hypothetical protein LBP52_09600, partial [Burkholderiaceae bacterium]|nr:hypothetical protein [Burkholderiaceae bacterium]